MQGESLRKTEPMRYEGLITPGAERDLEQLVNYIAEHDAPATANHVLAKLLDVIAGLANFPERGTYGRDLLTLGLRNFGRCPSTRTASFTAWQVRRCSSWSSRMAGATRRRCLRVVC